MYPGGPPGKVAPPGGPERVSGWRAVARVLRSPASLARIVADDLVTTVFPDDCRSCGAPLERAAAVPVCEACLSRVRRTETPGCSRCGEAIDLEFGLDLHFEDNRFARAHAESMVCRECRMAPPDYARAVSFATYRGELRELIHLLKFEHVPAVAKLLGSAMTDAVLQLEACAAAELLVVAVPLFPQQQRHRGYNQSVLLATEALRRLRLLRPQWKLIPAHGVLMRQRSTESSFALSRRERRRNLRGAFRVAGDVRGREVLLIDDILTSGATARECARVLMAAGAAKVWVATLARTQKERLVPALREPGEQVAFWDLAPHTAAGGQQSSQPHAVQVQHREDD